MHVMLCPAIMTLHWRKQLGKASDILVNIVRGAQFWPWEMFEPLTFACIFPLLRYPPWKAEFEPQLVDFKNKLPELLRKNKQFVRNSMQ
mmetsp:Transcript_2975/g.4186  ORF Transcript_2975/g.4186 Transcript_2975/m.4186 type:complete len:89 (+) Transcript_2975:1171-1437(+)